MNLPGKGLQKENLRTQRIYICSPNPFKTGQIYVGGGCQKVLNISPNMESYVLLNPLNFISVSDWNILLISLSLQPIESTRYK